MEREREKGGEVVNCLVDGCNADLRVCREYHRRHKVCEAHSKTPKVSISGRELRFCQQCSRFQSLVEFDEGKRSCRKRLDSHNRRRRKPQPQNPGLHFSNQPPGPTLVSFGSPQMVPTSWAGGAVNEVEYEQGMYSGDGGLVDSNGALSLLSTREVDFNLPWGLHTGLPHQETGNSVASSAPSTLHAQGSSSGGSHQTFTFMWE